jgi:hypothetical protein
MEIASFLAAPAGRPRRTTLRPSRTSASSNQALPREGASSGSRQAFFEERFFPTIRPPHRNDAPRFSSRRPHQHHNVGAQPSDRNESWLAIITTIVAAGHVSIVKNLTRERKVESTLLQRNGTPGLIERDPLELLYIQ